jgi:hypothetical protein
VRLPSVNGCRPQRAVNAQDYSYKWTYVSADKPTPCDFVHTRGLRAACINENGACHAVPDRVLRAQDFEPVVGEYLRRKMTRTLLVCTSRTNSLETSPAERRTELEQLAQVLYGLGSSPHFSTDGICSKRAAYMRYCNDAAEKIPAWNKKRGEYSQGPHFFPGRGR